MLLTLTTLSNMMSKAKARQHCARSAYNWLRGGEQVLGDIDGEKRVAWCLLRLFCIIVTLGSVLRSPGRSVVSFNCGNLARFICIARCPTKRKAKKRKEETDEHALGDIDGAEELSNIDMCRTQAFGQKRPRRSWRVR
jgi:hypothetical protein